MNVSRIWATASQWIKSTGGWLTPIRVSVIAIVVVLVVLMADVVRRGDTAPRANEAGEQFLRQYDSHSTRRS